MVVKRMSQIQYSMVGKLMSQIQRVQQVLTCCNTEFSRCLRITENMENVSVSCGREGQRVSKDMRKPGVHLLTLSSLLTILYLSATYIFYK